MGSSKSSNAKSAMAWTALMRHESPGRSGRPYSDEMLKRGSIVTVSPSAVVFVALSKWKGEEAGVAVAEVVVAECAVTWLSTNRQIKYSMMGSTWFVKDRCPRHANS